MDVTPKAQAKKKKKETISSKLNLLCIKKVRDSLQSKRKHSQV